MVTTLIVFHGWCDPCTAGHLQLTNIFLSWEISYVKWRWWHFNSSICIWLVSGGDRCGSVTNYGQRSLFPCHSTSWSPMGPRTSWALVMLANELVICLVCLGWTNSRQSGIFGAKLIEDICWKNYNFFNTPIVIVKEREQVDKLIALIHIIEFWNFTAQNLIVLLTNLPGKSSMSMRDSMVSPLTLLLWILLPLTSHQATSCPISGVLSFCWTWCHCWHMSLSVVTLASIDCSPAQTLQQGSLAETVSITRESGGLFDLSQPPGTGVCSHTVRHLITVSHLHFLLRHLIPVRVSTTLYWDISFVCGETWKLPWW